MPPRKKSQPVYRSVWWITGSTDDHFIVRDAINTSIAPRHVPKHSIPASALPIFVLNGFVWASCTESELISKEKTLHLWQFKEAERENNALRRVFKPEPIGGGIAGPE